MHVYYDVLFVDICVDLCLLCRQYIICMRICQLCRHIMMFCLFSMLISLLSMMVCVGFVCMCVGICILVDVILKSFLTFVQVYACISIALLYILDCVGPTLKNIMCRGIFVCVGVCQMCRDLLVVYVYYDDLLVSLFSFMVCVGVLYMCKNLYFSGM